MFERFTDRARKVSKEPPRNFTVRAEKAMEFAHAEAARFNAPEVGTDHILAGILADVNSIACQALKNMGVGLDELRREVDKLTGRFDKDFNHYANVTKDVYRPLTMASVMASASRLPIDPSVWALGDPIDPAHAGLMVKPDRQATPEAIPTPPRPVPTKVDSGLKLRQYIAGLRAKIFEQGIDSSADIDAIIREAQSRMPDGSSVVAFCVNAWDRILHLAVEDASFPVAEKYSFVRFDDLPIGARFQTHVGGDFGIKTAHHDCHANGNSTRATARWEKTGSSFYHHGEEGVYFYGEPPRRRPLPEGAVLFGELKVGDRFACFAREKTVFAKTESVNQYHHGAASCAEEPGVRIAFMKWTAVFPVSAEVADEPQVVEQKINFREFL
jgi:hypothetical protein